MPTISEPAYPLTLQSFESLRAHFLAGRIGEATFRVSLSILGLRGQDLDAEINLAKMEKKR